MRQLEEAIDVRMNAFQRPDFEYTQREVMMVGEEVIRDDRRNSN